MKFSIETEINGSLSFLNVKTFWENNKFITSAFKTDMLISVLFHLSANSVWYTSY